MTVERFNLMLLVGAAVLLVAVSAVRLAVRTGLPSLLIYVAIGLALGENGLGRIHFDDARLTQVIGYGALVIILAEGGLTTPWLSIRPAVPLAAVLATVGSLVSVFVTAVPAYFLLRHTSAGTNGEDWRLALLVGAIVSSTDAAAVFSVLRNVPLPRRLSGVLEAESGFNDAPILILVVELSRTGGQVDALHVLWELLFELSVGAALGLSVGWLGAFVLRRVALPASGLYPIAVVGFAVISYGATTTVGGSGFLAVYVSGLILGNSRLPHGPATRGFVDGLAWLSQIGLFVLLGLLATPKSMGAALLPGLAIGTVLLLVARPLSVALSLTPFRVRLREQAFLAWAGLRGGVPIVLATIPLVSGADDGHLFNVVFVIVVVFTLIQAPTLPWVARRLRLATPEEGVELAVDASPLGRLGADLLEVRIPPGSRLHGVEVFELRLPPGAAVSLLVRDGVSFVPGQNTPLRRGDELLLVVTAEAREQVERRLRAVSKGGRLAGWLAAGGRAPP